jgi:pentatricopeptide repeat protein
MNLHCYYSYTCLAVPSFLALLLVSISKENGQHVNAFTASLRTTIPFSYWNKVTTGTTATNNYGTQLHSTSSSNRQPRQKQQQPRRNEKGRGKRTPPSNNRASSSSPPQRKQTTIEKANQEYKEKRLTKRMIRQFQLLEKTMDEMKDSDKEGSTDGDEDGDDDVGAKSSSNNLQRQCDQLLGICAAANEWTKYQQVLDIMNDNPVVSYQHSSFYTSLRECYSNGNGLASIQIFEAIEKENKDIQITTQDIDLIIGALCKTNYNNGLWEKAVEIIHYAADNYDQINGNTDTTNTSKGSTAASTSTRTSTVSGGIRIESYNNVLIKMEHDKEWEEAMKLLSLMEKEDEQQQEGGRRHPSPNLATYHAVLSVLIADHQLDKATNLLLSLSSPTSKVQPSMYTFEMVMSALTAPTSSRNRNYKNNSNNEHYKQAIELLNTMNELKYIQNVPIELHNRVISSCIKARQTQSALSIFQNMRNSNSNAQQPDIVTYNSLISGCASAGLTKEAFQLFNEIRNRKVRSGGTGQKKEQDGTNQNQNDDDSNLVKPDVITYTNTVRACGRAKNAKKALLLLDDAKKQLIPLDVFIYTAVIDGKS